MTFKKCFKRIFSSILVAVTVFTAFSSVSCGVKASAADNKRVIFDFIVNEMGLNSAAACGILANIEHESGFNPNLYGDSGTSYGICQWHNTRLTNLKDYCNKNGYSWTSLTGQLYFLKYELNYCKGDTGSVINYLNVPNTADGAYQAGYNWCYYFERPANKAAKSESRGNLAKNTYWPQFGITYLLGDVNGDGKINSGDALLVIRYSIGEISFTSAQIKAADIDKNGAANSFDALIILKISTGEEKIENYK